MARLSQDAIRFSSGSQELVCYFIKSLREVPPAAGYYAVNSAAKGGAAPAHGAAPQPVPTTPSPAGTGPSAASGAGADAAATSFADVGVLNQNLRLPVALREAGNQLDAVSSTFL